MAVDVWRISRAKGVAALAVHQHRAPSVDPLEGLVGHASSHSIREGKLDKLMSVVMSIDRQTALGPERFWGQLQYIQKTLNTIANTLFLLFLASVAALVRFW